MFVILLSMHISLIFHKLG